LEPVVEGIVDNRSPRGVWPNTPIAPLTINHKAVPIKWRFMTLTRERHSARSTPSIFGELEDEDSNLRHVLRYLRRRRKSTGGVAFLNG
jgi:hypothetical protein